jgi:hypothetical protein
MLCNIGKYNDKATGQCSAIFEKIMARRRALLCNIGRDYCKATGQCSAILEMSMARRQDNALQF